MTIFDVLTMIGGLCLFLFGMNIMGDGLESLINQILRERLIYHLPGLHIK